MATLTRAATQYEGPKAPTFGTINLKRGPMKCRLLSSGPNSQVWWSSRCLGSCYDSSHQLCSGTCFPLGLLFENRGFAPEMRQRKRVPLLLGLMMTAFVVLGLQPQPSSSSGVPFVATASDAPLLPLFLLDSHSPLARVDVDATRDQVLAGTSSFVAALHEDPVRRGEFIVSVTESPEVEVWPLRIPTEARGVDLGSFRNGHDQDKLPATVGGARLCVLSRAKFQDRLSETGWTHIFVETAPRKVWLGCSNGVGTDSHKAYSAGVLEGLLTHKRIRDFFLNSRGLVAAMVGGPTSLPRILYEARKAVERIVTFSPPRFGVESLLAAPEPHDRLYFHSRLLLMQLWGISDGYEAARRLWYLGDVRWPHISVEDVVLLSADADYPDLKDAVNSTMTQEAGSATLGPGGCSKCHVCYHQSKHKALPFVTTPQTVSVDLPHALDEAYIDAVSGYRGAAGARHFDSTPAPKTDSSNISSHNSNGKSSRIGNSTSQLQSLQLAGNLITPWRIGRCSALVRLTSNLSDLFVGHTTWEPYSEMVRVLKYYRFPFEGGGTKTDLLAFSSYPGVVTSSDDFILTSTGLALTETTIDVQDRSIFRRYSHIVDERGSLPDFMRAVISARVASSANEFVKYFVDIGKHFLNVASAQWMVADYKEFVPHHGFVKRAFYLLETIPGFAYGRDMTDELQERGYWSSQNRAWFNETVARLGDDRRRSINPRPHKKFNRSEVQERAYTFSRLAPHTETLEDMKRVMQFSQVVHEHNRAREFSIAPRFDLCLKRSPEGATDSKIAGSAAFTTGELSFVAISGPQHQRDPPFSWAPKNKPQFDPVRWPHFGLPDRWNFTWQFVNQQGHTDQKVASPISSKLDPEDIVSHVVVS